MFTEFQLQFYHFSPGFLVVTSIFGIKLFCAGTTFLFLLNSDQAQYLKQMELDKHYVEGFVK